MARRGRTPEPEPDAAGFKRMTRAEATAFAMLGVAIPNAHIVDEDEEKAMKSFAVMAENWKAVKAFLSLATQWRAVSSMAGLIWTGLDYSAAIALLGRKRFTKLNAQLMVLEAEALPILNSTGEDT